MKTASIVFAGSAESTSRLWLLCSLLCCGLNLALAQMPVHVKQSLDRLVGRWEIETRIGERRIIEHATLEWSADETTLFYQGEGEKFAIKGQETRFSGVFGWDAEAQVVREFGFDNQGGTFVSEHRITPTSWSDTTTSTAVSEGKAVSEVFHRTFVFQSADEWTLEARDRVLQGQKGVTTRFRRIAHPSESPFPETTPWEWMLGHWTVERSDGSSARIHWEKPRPDAEFLLGTWSESDGTRSTEIAGWEPDCGHLVSSRYGVAGFYSSVRFHEVSRHEMKGLMRGRNAQGISRMGFLQLNRVSSEESRSTLVLSDGSILTQTFRKNP